MNFRAIVSAAFVLLVSLVISQPLAAQDEALAKRGRSLFQNRGCSACHGIGKVQAAPDLAGVTQRRPKEWIVRFLKDPQEMLATDSTAMALLEEWKGIKMPRVRLTDPEIDALLAYIESETAKRSS